MRIEKLSMIEATLVATRGVDAKIHCDRTTSLTVAERVKACAGVQRTCDRPSATSQSGLHRYHGQVLNEHVGGCIQMPNRYGPLTDQTLL